MARTEIEKQLIQARRLSQRGGIIVPYLHELLKSPLGIESEEDARWLYNLAMKQVKRDQMKQESYDNDEMVFSPSGLASCLRRVFLSKNHKQFGLERVELPRIEPHYYFFTGDFLHLKWQFAFYKLSLLYPDIHLVDCEIPILSKRKDHGGTLDILLLLDEVPLIIDVKGLNVRSFNAIDKSQTPDAYRIQVVDYGMLLNSAIQRGAYKVPPKAMAHLKNRGLDEFPKVDTAIVLAENKGGPDLNHPAALTEQVFRIRENLPEVRARLEILRRHEEEAKIPKAECQSTRIIDFTGCPFSEFCFKEVKRNEAKRAKASETKRLEISRPKRRSGSR